MQLTKEQLDHRAQEAKRLLNEPLLAEALETFRIEALQGLEDVDAANADEIRNLQAKAKVSQHIVDHLHSIITQSGEYDGGHKP